MSSGAVTPFTDFSNNANDTNENNAASVQPIADGEGVNATIAKRPSENLRQRTEAIRGRQADSFYLENADRTILIAGPGLVAWPGSTTAAASGIPTVSAPLWILPMLTPGFAQASPVPPVASAFGVIHLQRQTGPINAVAVTSQRRSYAAGDQINITVTPGSVFSCVLDVEDTGALRRTIKIVAATTTTCGDVITALNALTPPAPDNTVLVSAALEGGASSGDLIVTTQAKQYMTGNYDGEGHAITAANLASFFSGNPSQVLAEGDSLCVAYADLFDTASTGGRRQSIPENSNTAIPAGSFFNSRVHPDKLFNALPICKVVNGYLMFGTGCAVPAGATNFDLNGANAASVEYAGGGNWADGTTNPATTVEGQLDKIISDLAGATGTAKIEGSAVGTYLGAATLAAQISTITGFVHDDRSPTEASIVPLRVFRDFQGNARSLVDHRGQRMGEVSEIDENWAVTPVTVPVPMSAGTPAGGGSSQWGFNGGTWQFFNTSAGSTSMIFSLGGAVPVGAIITSVVFNYKRDTAGDSLQFQLLKLINGVGTLLVGTNSTSGTGQVALDIMATPSSGHGPQQASTTYDDLEIWVSANTVATTFELYSVIVTYILPPRGWTLSQATMGLITAGDALTFDAPDANINHRSLHLTSAASGSVSGIDALSGPSEVWLNTDVAFAMEFMVRTGTITDGAASAGFTVGMQAPSPNQVIALTAGSTGNWKLTTIVSLSANVTDSGVAIAANTTYRVRIEVYGINRNTTTKTRAVLYINGTKVAEDATRTYTDEAWNVLASVSATTQPSGPYDIRVGRIRRTWNHIAAGDLL